MFGWDNIHCAEDARRLARRRLPWMVFDYIDGAAGEGHGEALNRAALRDLRLRPRVLCNVALRDLSLEVFGHPARVPFGITPMGMCNLSTPGADLMLARLAARDRVPLGVSTVASTPLEEMIETAEGHAWFQLYFSGDGSGTMALVERARVAGYETLVVTLDVPEVGRRPRELRHGFRMPFRIGPRQFVDFALHPRWSFGTLWHGRPEMANFRDGGFDRTASRAVADWSYMRRLRDAWPGKLVIKGVLDADDALRLRDEGVDAIQVSGHGGRQLDGAPPPVLMLEKIRTALGPDFPLFFDSGLRSGEDIVKAHAMGADFVFVGRPLLFAMAAAGERGLHQLWEVLTEEVSLTLAQLGRTGMTRLGTCLARGA
ncbi:L-lactate dehydrogenase (cytochrome) [Roseovarius azorensis]|uniref:L-lactate dehydrogenase (Cytochrome) n=1 Tax=Roseovarius azorensis TaxID=1287727 RepID=A0A1H7R696_9RHOB|nr:alpha-hydroxy acid oxidase [Roseovarius azorensis]SEL55465.1 L-lactate dehydrogenase (cytochrome) [Roseovarius azorensis]